jgi:hypothetical protein
MNTSPEGESVPEREQLTPGELFKRASRLRLTRAGLLRIMKENEERARSRG